MPWKYWTAILLLWSAPLMADAALPNTRPLTWEGDFAAKMLDGMHRYIDRKMAESVESRQKFWRRDFSSREAY